MFMDFLIAMEDSGLGTWVRESPSLWAYPSVLFLHTLGLALLVGFSALIDLRLLGVAPDMPIKPLKKFFPLMAAGFWISALSGTALSMADASTMITNPLFIAKLGLVALAIGNTQIIRMEVFRDPDVDAHPVSRGVKLLAGTSLFLWVAVITAGRLTAYLGSSPGLHSLGS
jgi:hypothetical protein